MIVRVGWFISFDKGNINNYLELQWRQAPPCSSWDTGRVAPLSPGVKRLNYDMGNRDTKLGD